jgi:predicted regulator of Ras-like GTPase activity (Roadblock/LC7/MglB family)
VALDNIKDVLEEMAGHVEGLLGLGAVGMDGVPIATCVPSGSMLNIDLTAAQLATMFKLSRTTVDKLKAGEVEDGLLTTATSHILIKPIGDTSFLTIVVNKDTALGMLRLVAKTYSKRLVQTLPHGSE